MNIYISGISGTGMGPLALMAKKAGFEVKGSDKQPGPIVEELKKENIEFEIGAQDGKFLEKCLENGGIDWFVYTSALPKDHPELKLAQERGIKTSKRDEFIAFLVEKLNLKMVAVAGTHGKTTTTSMLIWAAKQLKIKAAYLVGTTLGFAESGSYEPGDEFFIYEADEYDRNFLAFHPWLSAITFVSYDHPDIYPTEEDYCEAFKQFESQSEKVIRGGEINGFITLAGKARKEDATTAFKVLKEMRDVTELYKTEEQMLNILNKFPGVGRRFEKIVSGVYSDYAHHPEEVAATIEIANEESQKLHKKGVVAIYEPHQNTRQHEVKDGYKSAFNAAEKVFWLPTYLTRENPELEILKPEDFIKTLDEPNLAEAVEMNDDLANRLRNLARDGYLILLMTAGPADAWLRKVFTAN